MLSSWTLGLALFAAHAQSTAAFRLADAASLPSFQESFASQEGLLKAARRSLQYLEGQPPRVFRLGERDYGSAVLADSARALISLIEKKLPAEQFSAAVAETFDVFQSPGSDGAGKVVFSSYYQPVLAASLKKSESYPHPIYRKPADMVDVDLSAFDKKYEGQTLVGRVDKKTRRLVPYYSRDEINAHGALAGKGFEIAWLKDRFDVLDLHIQGSGILQFPSGKKLLARYAATNAHGYQSAALLLVKAGVFSREEISHDKVRAYFRAHPESQNWVMSHNPRFTFFDLVPLPKDGEPFGTTNQALVPARSIAFDASVLPLGALTFFTTISPQADKDGKLLGLFPNSRFAFILDTGGAIKGPGRVDIYAGHGPQAAATARQQWHEGKLWVLVKKLPPRER